MEKSAKKAQLRGYSAKCLKDISDRITDIMRVSVGRDVRYNRKVYRCSCSVSAISMTTS
jgi:hypothetical protein